MSLKMPSRFVPFVLFFVALIVALPAGVSAAAIELTSSLKASLDKTAASADAKKGARLRELYAELGTQLKADKDAAAKVKALQYRNEEAAILVRKQIREIDAAKVSRSAADVQQAKTRYKPLFDGYTALNKQLSLAKSLKSKTLSSALSLQAQVMKLSVQAAREDIKKKEAAHKAAKTAASGKIKAARDSLAAIDSLKVQIRAQRSSLSATRNGLSPVWSNFKYALKKNDAGSAGNALASLVASFKSIVAQQSKIYALETKISDTISATRARYL